MPYAAGQSDGKGRIWDGYKWIWAEDWPAPGWLPGEQGDPNYDGSKSWFDLSEFGAWFNDLFGIGTRAYLENKKLENQSKGIDATQNFMKTAMPFIVGGVILLLLGRK